MYYLFFPQRMADMKKRTEEDKQRELAFFVSLDNWTGILG